MSIYVYLYMYLYLSKLTIWIIALDDGIIIDGNIESVSTQIDTLVVLNNSNETTAKVEELNPTDDFNCPRHYNYTENMYANVELDHYDETTLKSNYDDNRLALISCRRNSIHDQNLMARTAGTKVAIFQNLCRGGEELVCFVLFWSPANPRLRN